MNALDLTGQITEIAPYVRTYFWLPSGMSTMPITEDFRFKYRIAFIHPAIKTGFLTVILRGLDIDLFTIIYIYQAWCEEMDLDNVIKKAPHIH